MYGVYNTIHGLARAIKNGVMYEYPYPKDLLIIYIVCFNSTN